MPLDGPIEETVVAPVDADAFSVDFVDKEMDFFAESDLEATRQFNTLMTAIEAEPWCLNADKPSTVPHKDGKGISADNIKIEVDPKKVDVS